MAEQFYTILTNIGKAKIANSLPTGQKVNLTKIKIGDSNGTYYNPSENQTDLVHKVYECNVTSVDVDENNPNWITITAAIPSNVGGFSIREVGVFDDSNSLIAIGKYPETYKPVASDGSTKELYIKMTLEVTNASSVELKIDPTVILATKKDISNLDAKIEKNSSQLNDIVTINVKGLGFLAKGDGVADDTAIIQSIFNNCENGSIIYFPKGTYKITNNIVLNNKKNITIKGSGKPIYDSGALVGGTIIKGGRIILGYYNPVGSVSGIVIKDLGVENTSPSTLNGIEGQGNVNDVYISNVNVIANHHCFLFQSYVGLERNINLMNCETHDAIHGFIIKCSDASLINCRAYNHTTNGFAAISDNIVGSGNVAITRNVKFINCYSESCSNGFNFYSRDMFSDTNVNNLRCSDIELANCLSQSCVVGYNFGDGGTPASGVTYNNVFAISAINCHESNSTNNSMSINRIKDSFISGSVEVELNLTSLFTNVKLNITSYKNYVGFDDYNILPTGQNPVISAIPKKDLMIFRTNNTTPTLINSIIGSTTRELILIKIDEDNSIIRKYASSIFDLNCYEYRYKGSWVLLKKDSNGRFNEIAGHNVRRGAIWRDIVSDGTPLDLSQSSLWDISSGTTGATTINKISVANRTSQSETLTLCIRSTGGTLTIGGLDSSSFVVPSSFPTTFAYGTVYITQWVYILGLAKYICISANSSSIS